MSHTTAIHQSFPLGFFFSGNIYSKWSFKEHGWHFFSTNQFRNTNILNFDMSRWVLNICRCLPLFFRDKSAFVTRVATLTERKDWAFMGKNKGEMNEAKVGSIPKRMQCSIWVQTWRIQYSRCSKQKWTSTQLISSEHVQNTVICNGFCSFYLMHFPHKSKGYSSKLYFSGAVDRSVLGIQFLHPSKQQKFYGSIRPNETIKRCSFETHR